MFTRSAKLATVGAFFTGGILVGGVTAATDFTHVGATTAPAPGKGQSSAEYTSVNAWVQEVTTAESNMLVIPSGQRLTVTDVTSTLNSQPSTVTGAVNGAAADYVLYATVDESTHRPSTRSLSTPAASPAAVARPKERSSSLATSRHNRRSDQSRLNGG